MSRNNKNKLVPKLRFPEFKDSGEWEGKQLKDIARTISNGLTLNQNQERKGYKVTRIETISNGDINIDKVGFVETPDDVSSYKLNKGDILLSHINSLEHIGKVAYFDANTDLYHGMNLLRIVISQKLCSKFVFYQLTTSQIKHIISNRANKAVNQASINQTELGKVILSIPSLPEQQKIAACLSSLDEVITAESQKLEVLKDHKKGLLQNLFPKEGENVPKLRFPEFKDSGEWKEKTIEQVTKVTTGGTPESTNPKYWGGNIPWMNSGELNLKKVYEVANRITIDGLNNSSTKIIPKQCVLIGLAGQGKTRGTAAINYIELCTNQSIASIHPNKDVFVSEFLYYKIDSMYEYLRKLSAGDGGRGGLNLQLIKSIKISLPSLFEQQKIADTLSSIDDLINAQTQKIDLLKLHKKGLLQGLFPTLS